MKKKLIILGSVFLVLVVSGLVLIGCDKPKPKNIPSLGHSLNAGELINLIEITNKIVPSLGKRVSDEMFIFPTRVWVTNDFAKSFDKFLKSINRTTYIANVYDCNIITEMAKSWAAVLNANSLNRPEEGVLAVCEFQYYMIDGTGHSLLLFWIFENNKFVPLFFEPQLRREVFLKQEEIDMCIYYRF